MSLSGNNAAQAATAVKEKGIAALKAILQRRYVIICVAGVLAVAMLLYLLLPLIPRKAKPYHYRVGELSIEAITEAVGYRKVVGISQSLSGVGRAEAGTYTYKAGKIPRADIETYYEMLMKKYDAEMSEDSVIGEDSGTLLLTMPALDKDSQITMKIDYNTENYTITVDEMLKPKEKEDSKSEFPANVTPEQAKELLMSLTKKETGFTADISVYTTTQEPDTVSLDGWDYYVFTTVADYSAKRIEYRGTFYVGCYDGIILSFDKDTGVTSRLRGPDGKVEKE